MTAVVSPPILQPLSGWNPNNDGQGGLNSMNADEVSRMFMPRKSVQRMNSSSSVATSLSSSSNSSTSSTFTIPIGSAEASDETSTANGEQGGWGPKKKPPRGLWPSSKAEPVLGLSNGRSPALPTPSSGQSAASTMSAMHQPSPILNPHNRPRSIQEQNGTRTEHFSLSHTEPPAVLTLIPLTGTFERKQVSVPFFPEVLRIGRQTNAKTMPTPTNGYFDSKVLSRQHAEVWAEKNGKVWIRDVKSSNGTFVNGVRLSPENRDSEPHELREQDTLELGIDIVSEDQKSIVHHKVSAKVEYAGIYGKNTSILDINFGDADPTSGGLLLSQPMSNGISQLRGRGNSQGSTGGNGRTAGLANMASSSQEGLVQQRQMNFWMNPITVEEVVKKLTMELKQAKQHSQDLHRTGDFIGTFLTLEPGEEPPKAPEQKPSVEPKVNGVSPTAPPLGAISPYSQPPAPPPQQPLPEKPDVARFVISDPMNQLPLRRVETEKAKSGLNSPTKSEPPSSQMLSLIEALTIARREIDSQGDRVKQLEHQLQKERKARETAEEQARRLLAGDPLEGEQKSAIGVEDPIRNSAADSSQEKSKSVSASDSTSVNNRENVGEPPLLLDEQNSGQAVRLSSETVNVSTTQLQEKLDAMVREMDEMKTVMESYKRRAEGAEEERRSLTEMVKQIRANEAGDIAATLANGGITSSLKGTKTDESSTTAVDEGAAQSSGLWNGTSISLLPQPRKPNGNITSPKAAVTPENFRNLEGSILTALQQDYIHGTRGGREVMVQSAPYVSVIGVVLIGVGLMAWLNGWQKIER